MRVLCRYTMKHLAEAYKRYFAGAGFPDGKRKYKDTPQFTVPQDIKIKGQKIYIPKIGWARLTGQNPYADCQPKQAMFKYEARDGYVSILYAVPDPRPARPANPMHPVGIDRNVGQVALSTEVMYALPGLAKRDAKLHRRQRKLARQQYKSNGWQRTKLRMPKVQRKIVNVIKDWCHQTRRTIADIHDVVILAALNMQGMTQSARGSKENPGQHVAQNKGPEPCYFAQRVGALETVYGLQDLHSKDRPQVHVTVLSYLWCDTQGQPEVPIRLSWQCMRWGKERRCECGPEHPGQVVG